MRNAFVLSIFLILPPRLFALDIKYAPIVNKAIADLKTHSKLALLKGHVAINITSGNKELDLQFAEALQNAYPNFASKADAVNREDLYQMTVKVYRENNEAQVSITVTNYKQEKIAGRTVNVKNVQAGVMETLQHKTAIAAKNEFEAYLDTAFGGAGEVMQEANVIPPKPKEPFVMPDLQIEGGAQISAFSGVSNYGWELFGIYPFIGIRIAERFRISAFAGGGISLKEDDKWFLYWTYNFGGDFDVFFDKHIVSAGAGMENSNSAGIERKLYPFIRAAYGLNLLEDIFYNDMLSLKLYVDYKFDITGFKLGVLFIYYKYL